MRWLDRQERCQSYRPVLPFGIAMLPAFSCLALFADNLL